MTSLQFDVVWTNNKPTSRSDLPSDRIPLPTLCDTGQDGFKWKLTLLPSSIYRQLCYMTQVAKVTKYLCLVSV